MRREDVRDLTRAGPFRPFRIPVSNGAPFDGRHPERIMATTGAAHPDRPGGGERG